MVAGGNRNSARRAASGSFASSVRHSARLRRVVAASGGVMTSLAGAGPHYGTERVGPVECLLFGDAVDTGGWLNLCVRAFPSSTPNGLRLSQADELRSRNRCYRPWAEARIEVRRDNRRPFPRLNLLLSMPR